MEIPPAGIANRPPTTNVESEAKLLAPARFRLPDLSHLVAHTVVEDVPECRLEATYYDTPDLRLARSGITLRHRTGDGGPAWTVKLPRDGQGPALTRLEIGFDSVADHAMPEQAVDLVLATTRAQHLHPVATLDTVRLPTGIRDRHGNRLAEIVDDTVTVSRDGEPAGQFREIEVEVAADAPAELLPAAVARLVDAGCVAQPAIPKLIRALGERATQPPDVVVEPLPGTPGTEDLIRHALARSVAQIVRHDPGVRLGSDPEDVHQLRVATRRLRSDLRTFAGLLDHTRCGLIREELGWLATAVGAVRDTDVLAARLRATGQTLPAIDRSAVAVVLHRLQVEADTARAAMLEALRSPRYVTLLDALISLAATPPLAPDSGLASRAASRVAPGLVRKPWQHLMDAVAALPSRPPDEALHRIRILAKRCRYAAEAVSPVMGKPAIRFASRLADLQTVLGDHHDTAVAETWLRDAAIAEPASAVAVGELIAIERTRRAGLRAQWPALWTAASTRKLRQWL